MFSVTGKSSELVVPVIKILLSLSIVMHLRFVSSLSVPPINVDDISWVKSALNFETKMSEPPL